MGTLKFRKGEIEFEYSGEPEDIKRLIEGLTHPQSQIAEHAIHSSAGGHKELEAAEQPLFFQEKNRLLVDLPSSDEIKKYILSHPDFAHDIMDVQRHFFGRTFKARGETQLMYHRTNKQLREVRAQIEREQNGYFAPFPIEKNLIKYIFKKNTALEVVKPTNTS